MTNETQQEALSRAEHGQSMANYPAIYAGFAAKGITDAQPRVNVFTFHAWKAKGRSVKKGEHGVKIVTYIPVTRRDDDGEEIETGRRPKTTTVFHLSQTEDSASRQKGH